MSTPCPCPGSWLGSLCPRSDSAWFLKKKKDINTNYSSYYSPGGPSWLTGPVVLLG